MIYARANKADFDSVDEWATFPDQEGHLGITATFGANVFMALVDGSVINIDHVVLAVPNVALEQAFENTGQSLKDFFGI